MHIVIIKARIYISFKCILYDTKILLKYSFTYDFPLKKIFLCKYKL